VAENADELIAKPVSLTGEPVHRLGHRFIDRFVESAYVGEVRAPRLMLTGHPPLSVQEFVRNNAAAFTMPAPLMEGTTTASV
jgi:hypothetical protein